MRKEQLLFSVLLFWGAFLSVQSTHAETKNIGDNLYTYTTSGEYISMFVVTSEGVMVFETVNSKHANLMVDEIKKITKKPIKYAFHSHNHWDHSSGGQIFVDEGATTVAHQEAYDWMEANTGRDMTLPMETWSGNRKDYVLGDVKVELHYLGINHGMGMTVFLLPKYNLAYIADIVTPNRIIFALVPDFNLKEWQRTLKEVRTMDFTKAVFSHNEKTNPMEAGDKNDVKHQLEYIQDLRAGFFAELEKGTSPFDIPKKLKLPKYKNWVGYDQWLEMNVWRVLSAEFLGPYPWRRTHPIDD